MEPCQANPLIRNLQPYNGAPTRSFEMEYRTFTGSCIARDASCWDDLVLCVEQRLPRRPILARSASVTSHTVLCPSHGRANERHLKKRVKYPRARRGREGRHVPTCGKWVHFRVLGVCTEVFEAWACAGLSLLLAAVSVQSSHNYIFILCI